MGKSMIWIYIHYFYKSILIALIKQFRKIMSINQECKYLHSYPRINSIIFSASKSANRKHFAPIVSASIRA